MTIRTDLQSTGVYILKEWLIRSMPTLEEFMWTDDDQDYEFATLNEDFIPFLAKN